MKSKKIKKKKDTLPDSFSSEDEAGDFWDSHSTGDYEEFLELADVKIAIKRRHYEIEIDEDIFVALNTLAKKNKKSVKNLANHLLKEKLVSV